ncbi:MAG: OprO/OprP family phosphate-selective porin [Proteobacteria bacterium]|nr:OprO/OprP family phosphate-selective porin [Pseudomonadota bacterium]MBU1546064.1 OprO/OprP family phosphate-selective porin [Pseudomonadota bacterium]MBU2619824.1 OprO/OprP family phosphate-selective porin [Pseudomonadota bacterium]
MRRTLRGALLVGVFAFSLPEPAHAVNWLMLQGTEPGNAPLARFYGDVTADYQYTDDTRVPTGPWLDQKAVYNQIGPRLASSSQLTLRKIRVGVRGALPDPRFNYRVMALAGDNDVTRIDSEDRMRLLDASLTANVIPHARFRLGMFKYPGAEEGLQFNAPGPYVNLSNMGSQLLQERFYDNDGGNPLDANIPGASSTFRDMGVMLFDSFRTDAWEHSYAAMLGNGRGISTGGGSPGQDIHLYWSSEYIFSGKGMQQEGLKLFAWLQDGERTIKAGNLQSEQDFNRSRLGAGGAYRQGNLRATVELVKAEGMIPNSTDSGGVPGALSNAGNQVSSYNLLPEEDGCGWYIDLGYQVLPGWWFDVRYDRLDRGTELSSNERRFTTLTLGTHYYFNPKTRLMFNYEIRKNEAPSLADNAAPNILLESYDDRVSVQLFRMF